MIRPSAQSQHVAPRGYVGLAIDVAAGLCLLIGLGVAVLWARSYAVIDSVDWHRELPDQTQSWWRRIESSAGGLRASDFHSVQSPDLTPEQIAIWKPRPGWQRWRSLHDWQFATRLSQQWAANLVTFRVLSETDQGTILGASPAAEKAAAEAGQPYSGTWSSAQWVAQAPHWAVALPAIGWPVLRWRRRVRRRRETRAGLCLKCGYDLRGNPAADRCPECGTPTTKPGEPQVPPAPI